MQVDEWAIGRRIATHRARRGLTQEELAGLAGISLSLIKKDRVGRPRWLALGYVSLFVLFVVIGKPLPKLRKDQTSRLCVIHFPEGIRASGTSALEYSETQTRAAPKIGVALFPVDLSYAFSARMKGLARSRFPEGNDAQVAKEVTVTHAG